MRTGESDAIDGRVGARSGALIGGIAPDNGQYPPAVSDEKAVPLRGAGMKHLDAWSGGRGVESGRWKGPNAEAHYCLLPVCK